MSPTYVSEGKCKNEFIYDCCMIFKLYYIVFNTISIEKWQKVEDSKI